MPKHGFFLCHPERKRRIFAPSIEKRFFVTSFLRMTYKERFCRNPACSAGILTSVATRALPFLCALASAFCYFLPTKSRTTRTCKPFGSSARRRKPRLECTVYIFFGCRRLTMRYIFFANTSGSCNFPVNFRISASKRSPCPPKYRLRCVMACMDGMLPPASGVLNAPGRTVMTR